MGGFKFQQISQDFHMKKTKKYPNLSCSEGKKGLEAQFNFL